MKLNVFDSIIQALSVGTWLQNALFYFLLLVMSHVTLFQSKLSNFRLRSGIAEGDIE